MTSLDEALRSLREDVNGESQDADATLERILRAKRARPPVTRVRLVALLAAAFFLLGSMAWAAYARLAREPHRAPADATSRTKVSAPPAPSAVPSVDSRNAEAPPVPGDPELSTNPVPTPSAPPSAGSAGGAPSSKKASNTAELAAFEKGHRAQYSEHDPSQALALWNDFLARFPGSRWEPDVRYNRALCLIRLHRTLEAEQALEPFARGYGGYRQREAVLLLAALKDAGP